MKFFRKFVFLLAGCGLMIAAGHAQAYLDNALYVKFKESSSVSAKKFQKNVVPIETLKLKITAAKTDEFGLHREADAMQLFNNAILDRTFRIQFDSTKKIDKLIRLLEKDPNVEYVERVSVAKIMSVTPDPKSVPDDPFYQTIDGVEYQWYLKLIHAEEAWALQQGDPSIIAAVVDGAIWADHPELNIPQNRQYNAGNSTSGNSNPPYSNQDLVCTKLYAGPNESDPCPPYSWSHGTHCIGVVGAKNNNGTGIASLASGVTLLAVAANWPSLPDNVVNGYGGIKWAAEQGARVISCSWGSIGIPSYTEEEILKSCYDNNIVVVAAAGNDNTNELTAPASSPYVISVGSVDESKNKSSFSNYGAWVDILAPGGTGSSSNRYTGIVSTTFCKSQSLRLRGINTFNDQYYDEMSGTSMATPLVASLCALMLSRNPALTPQEIKTLLQNSSESIPSLLFSPLSGVINAEAALRAIDEARFEAAVENLTITKNIVDSVWFRWDPPVGNTHTLLGYRVYRNGTVLDSLTTKTEFLDSLAPSGIVVYQVAAIYEDNYISVRKETRITLPDFYIITTYAIPEEGGTVKGAGKYKQNDVVFLSAEPNPGYKFSYWSRSGREVSSRPNYSFRATANQIYSAIFETETANTPQKESLVEIVPNPVKSNIKVLSPVPVQRLRICDLQGHFLLEAEGNLGTELTLEVESLAAGSYILMMETTEGLLSKKFIKL